MIIVDSSELRTNSRLDPQGTYSISNTLEAVTGADVMVSPVNFPATTELLIKKHIEAGAKLIQLKFGHDLTSSIIDGRYKEAQSRMKLVGANPWQCILLFVGVAHADSDGLLMINKQLVYGMKHQPTYEWYTVQVDTWLSRGGGFINEFSPANVWTWFTGIEKALEKYKQLPQKQIWPKSPVLHDSELETMDSIEYLRTLSGRAQTLELVDDIRVLYAVLPGIGPSKAQAIYDSGIDNITKLLQWLDDDSVKVKGIGEGIKNKVKGWLENE